MSLKNRYNAFKYWCIDLAFLLCFPFKKNKFSKNLFLSSMRSGTNLTLASLSFIVRKPVGSISGRFHYNNNSMLPIDYISSDPFILRTHFPWFLNLFNREKSNLVLLTRNPKELIFRSNTIASLKDLKTMKVKKYIKHYIKNFRVFEKWNKNKKLLIFYEDLTDNLENNLLNILELIGEEPVYMNDFVLHKDKYLEMIRKSYTSEYKTAGRSSSKGVTLKFYSMDKDPGILTGIEQMLRKEDPYIYDKYLKRFEG